VRVTTKRRKDTEKDDAGENKEHVERAWVDGMPFFTLVQYSNLW
jgi:hypothetical protein